MRRRGKAALCLAMPPRWCYSLPMSSLPAFSPAQVHIDLGCIRRNLHRLGVAPQAVMPVVKSDAYGHGLLPVARALGEEGVTHLAVGTVDEGVYLRQAGMGQRVVSLLGASGKDELTRAVKYGITPLIHSLELLTQAAHLTGHAGRPLAIALKCETGMARLGIEPQHLPAALEILRAAPGLRVDLALSHFACADMPEHDALTRHQGTIFSAMSATIADAFPSVRRTLCNSPGALAYRDLAGDLLRPGQALYGCNPLHATDWEHLGADLEPAMSVCAPILQVHGVLPGQSVSYGAIFVAQRPMRLAVIGIGYADGFPRRSSNRGEVMICGHRAPVCGRVCMGMFMADVTDIPAHLVHSGEMAWIAGGPYPNAVSLQEVADLWGTIPYEVQCSLGRNTRVYS